MNSFFVDEPELEFGLGRHIDIRAGLTHLGALDSQGSLAPKRIRIGVIGEQSALDAFAHWVEQCRDGVAAKETALTTLFPRFPGFGEGKLFCDFFCAAQLTRALSRRELTQLAQCESRGEVIVKSAEYLVNEMHDLVQNAPIDVCVCLLPETLMRRIDASEVNLEDGYPAVEGVGGEPIWHDFIKATAVRLQVPIQVVRPATYGGKVHRFRADGKASKEIEDEASRAWNFFTGIYYKSKGIPWRLQRTSEELAACYIGVSFFHEYFGDGVAASVAQVFNERGEGVVLRGGRATVTKDDRSLHLTGEAINKLVADVLKLYRSEHRHLPARVVVHKSSYFTHEELEGCQSAIDMQGIDSCELLSLRKSNTRFFRNSSYPPLRGTAVELDSKTALLYTQGSVDFYRACPSKYVPRPLEVRLDAAESGLRSIMAELLALTKMNWNSTRFVNAMPITLSAARKVGDIIRYIAPDQPIHSRYSHYM